MYRDFEEFLLVFELRIFMYFPTNFDSFLDPQQIIVYIWGASVLVFTILAAGKGTTT